MARERAKKVLFSNQIKWVEGIRGSLNGSRYMPVFGDLSQEDINQYDLVVPLTIADQQFLNENIDSAIQNKAIFPSNVAMDLCSNKEDFMSFMIKNGFSEHVPVHNKENCFPYMLKIKYGAWGTNIFIVNDCEQELYYKDLHVSNDFIVQACIKGKHEYVSHIVFNNNRVHFMGTLKSTFADDYFIKGKQHKPVSVEKTNHQQYREQFGEILSSMGFKGICCVDYKILDGAVKIFEINPRFCGSMPEYLSESLLAYDQAIKGGY